MSWAIGYDGRWSRDIGYGVVAFCDHPGCGAEVNRGLGCVCGGEPYGGERGCGLYFCGKHLNIPERINRATQLCDRCYPRSRTPFKPTFEHPLWLRHKLTDPSWADWRAEQGEEQLTKLRDRIGSTMCLDLTEDTNDEEQSQETTSG